MSRTGGLCLAGAVALGLSASMPVHAQDKGEALDGYHGIPRTLMWASGAIEFTDTSEFKKDPPYRIGFSNASISNIWRVGMLHAIEQAAADNSDMISELLITDANDDPQKQVSDIQDLIERDVDILIVSAATADALDRAVTGAMRQGIPVVMVDRRVTSDNFVSFVTASDHALGRFNAAWLVETLGGEGNIIMLPGIAGASPAELRIAAAREIFNQYPGIKILDMQYTDWSPARGKQVMSALIQRFGDQIDGVWNDSGLQGSGSIEAFLAAGYAPGTIPPHTCGDLNGCVKLAVQNEVPVINFDYPPRMGYDSVKVALDTLQGKPVPKIYEINADVVVSKGYETATVRADMWAEDYAQLDKPDELILSTGLGPDYDPNTFSVDYPQ